jgi:outer membrane protein, heavy metal efflux system
MRKFAPLLALVLLIPSALPSFPSDVPPNVLLEALVQSALQNNPGLNAERAKLQALRQVPSQARALPDPVADIEFMNLPVSHPSLKAPFESDVSIGLTQTLPFPGKRALAGKKAEDEAAAEEARLKTMESELRGQVIAAAYRYAMVRNLLAINDQTQEALKATAESAAAVYSSGEGSQSDILLAQTALTRTKAEREDLEKQQEITRARLSSLLAGPPPEGTLTDLELPEPGPISTLDDLLKVLPDSSPGVLAAKADATVTQAQVEIARRNFKPDFIVGGRYRWKDSTMGGGDYLTAMAGISLPFFHRKDRYKPALAEALFLKESAQYGVDDAVNSNRFALAEAYQTALRSKRVYGLYKEGLLIQARVAFQSALSAYSVGKVDFASVLIALTSLYSYEADAVMAQGDFQEALAKIESVIGHPLVPLDHPPQGPPAPDPSSIQETKP